MSVRELDVISLYRMALDASDSEGVLQRAQKKAMSEVFEAVVAELNRFRAQGRSIAGARQEGVRHELRLASRFASQTSLKQIRSNGGQPHTSAPTVGPEADRAAESAAKTEPPSRQGVRSISRPWLHVGERAKTPLQRAPQVPTIFLFGGRSEIEPADTQRSSQPKPAPSVATAPPA
jgi:hypothetical protein